MDPTRQLHTPIAEVRAQAPIRDEYGEQWVVIDGIETKVPNIKAARALLAQQDKTRENIRAEMDALGLRFNPDGTDREDQVEITLEDGTKTTVGLFAPGKANYLQIESFPDAEGLFANAAKAQSVADVKEAAAKQLMERAQLEQRSPLQKIRDKIASFFRKDPS